MKVSDISNLIMFTAKQQGVLTFRSFIIDFFRLKIGMKSRNITKKTLFRYQFMSRKVSNHHVSK